MQPTPAPTDPAPRRSHRVSLTLLGLLAVLGATLFPSLTASANEFVPIPSAGEISAECVPGNGLHVVLVLENKGLGLARFLVTKFIDDEAPTVEQFDVYDQEIVIDVDVPESSIAGFSLDSDSGAGFHGELFYGPVDCLADPTAEIVVVCPTGEMFSPEIKFSLVNPSVVSATLDISIAGLLTTSSSVASTTEPYTISAPIDNGSHVQALVKWGDVQLASLDTIVDCAVLPPVVIDTIPEPTTPVTTIPVTTIPVTTIPVTTIPVTTIPVTTIPVTTIPGPLPEVTTTQAIPPTPVTVEVSDQTVARPVAAGPTSLPRTGSESGTMAMVGFGLFLSGAVLVLATRRARLADHG